MVLVCLFLALEYMKYLTGFHNVTTSMILEGNPTSLIFIVVYSVLTLC
jgi:hypothetical protein